MCLEFSFASTVALAKCTRNCEQAMNVRPEMPIGAEKEQIVQSVRTEPFYIPVCFNKEELSMSSYTTSATSV